MILSFPIWWRLCRAVFISVFICVYLWSSSA
jgi:hypothetical protein